MERRKAPSSFARRTFIAFEVYGAVGFGTGIGTTVLLRYLWPDAPFFLYTLTFGAGFALFLTLFLRLHPRFKCPECGRELGKADMLGAKEGEPIRYVCPKCQIEWESGMSVP